MAVNRLLLAGLLSFLICPLWSQTGPAEQNLADELMRYKTAASLNLLTVYVIPSKVPYDWSSPHSLYKSYFKNYNRNILKREYYLLGHVFIELSTPLSDSVVLTGMRSASREEQKNKVLMEKYGLSILGADLEGRLETREELSSKVDRYSRCGEMAFMTLIINDQATQRMLEFFRQFRERSGDGFLPEEHYGGAYWPRYYGEGAGCSAFALSFLSVGGLLLDEFMNWMIRINIPTDLLGGPYNPGNNVTLKEIRKTYCWAESADGQEKGYAPFEIYDPSLIFNWITKSWASEQIMDGFRVARVKINKARGILMDMREENVPENETLFMERKNKSIFVGGLKD